MELIAITHCTYDGDELITEAVPVLARRGDFVVHRGFVANARGWRKCFTVTHAPTGQACLEGFRRYADAIACATAFARSELDWSLTTPEALTPLHRQVGIALCQRFAPQVIPAVPAPGLRQHAPQRSREQDR